MRGLRTESYSKLLNVNSNTFEFRLMICQFLNLACLIEQLNTWLIAYALVSLLWQFTIVLNVLKTPATTLKIIFALSGVTILALSSLSMGILLSMVHLLCLAYILKPLELKKKRDVQQVKLLNLFVLGAALIFHQSIQFAVVILVLLVVNIALFSDSFVSSSKLKSYKLTAKLLCQSLPMAILLFIVFPKLGPFWQMPQASSAKVGLTDTIKIGDISNLALSNELAFRVEFDDYQPNPSSMYWRTIVLENFDGISWSRPYKVARRGIRPENYDGAFNYSVFVEPNNQTWLFGLDVAWLRSNSVGSDLADYTMRSNAKISNKMIYQVLSTPNAKLEPLIAYSQKRKNLLIPESSNPKLTRYGQELRQKYRDDKKIIQAVLATFNQDNYRYTLKPPLLANNSLDQFFFDTKAGFCEHYASSFAYLMRAANIPARVVVGYQGGELNERGGYYSVFQRDAHAWSEVWLPSEGWTRVDPTAAVDIFRIEQGFYAGLLQEQRELSGNLEWVDKLVNVAWVTNIRAMIDVIDYQWTKWVIGYSATSQLQLLSYWLGEFSTIKVAAAILVVIVGCILILWLINKQSFIKNTSTIQVEYMNRLRRLLKAKGCDLEPSDTGETLVNKASQINKNLNQPVKNFIYIFQKLEYADSTDGIRAGRIKQLKAQWKSIKRIV